MIFIYVHVVSLSFTGEPFVDSYCNSLSVNSGLDNGMSQYLVGCALQELYVVPGGLASWLYACVALPVGIAGVAVQVLAPLVFLSHCRDHGFYYAHGLGFNNSIHFYLAHAICGKCSQRNAQV